MSTITWQIRDEKGCPIAFVKAITAVGAILIERNKRCQQDAYYDNLWQVAEINGVDIRLK